MSSSEEYFHLIGKAIKGANSGKIFGHLCYGIGKKPFFFLEEEDAVFKLKGKWNEEARNLKEAKFFDPMGSENKTKSNPPASVNSKSGRAGWVQLPFSQKDHWEFYAKIAFKQLKMELSQNEQ